MHEQATVFSCPDCEREGVDFLHPIETFYQMKDKHYRGGTRRSTYCKRHHNARVGARKLKRLRASSPQYDAAFHERQKASKRDSIARARAAKKAR